jgi:hypothetical protein
MRTYWAARKSEWSSELPAFTIAAAKVVQPRSYTLTCALSLPSRHSSKGTPSTALPQISFRQKLVPPPHRSLSKRTGGAALTAPSRSWLRSCERGSCGNFGASFFRSHCCASGSSGKEWPAQERQQMLIRGLLTGQVRFCMAARCQILVVAYVTLCSLRLQPSRF